MISELRETLYSCLVPLQRHQNESKGVKFCDIFQKFSKKSEMAP